MKDQWYCRVEGQQFGPFSWDQMRAMAAEGRLVSESHVRREGDQRWFAAGKIPGLLPLKTDDASAVGAVSVGATAKAQAADASSMAITTTTVAASGPPPVVSRSQTNGKANGHVSDSSSAKLKVAKPRSASQQSADASGTVGEPTPPPPVAKATVSKKNGQTPPLPVPAADASPLGIVMAPPVAAPSKSGKGTGKVGKSGAHPALQTDEKGLSPLLVGGVLGGVALVLVAIGGGLVAWQQMTKQKADQLAAATAKQKVAEAKPAISDAELDAILGPITVPEPGKPVEAPPADAAANAKPGDVAANAAPGAPEAVAAPPAPADPKVEAARKLIAAQKRWTPVEGVVIRGRDIQVEVAQIWLATDAKGSRIDPILPSPGATAPPPAAAASAAASSSKFIFVDVRVSNTGAIPRKYTSWNTGGNVTAILAHASGEPLAFVPPAETPDVPRLASLHIPAGQTIGDVLVFQAPPQPFESLKLLLAQTAFATAGRNFTLEVPVEFLFKRAEGLPPQTALAADDGAPGEGEGVPAAPAKPVDPNAPPSLEDFTKSLENDKKMLDKQNPAEDAPPKPKLKPKD